MQRLPQTRKSTDSGVVYVIKRGNIYKVGFTRRDLRRRIRDCGGSLLLIIPVGARPSVLESLVHRRLKDRRVEGPRFKREWFQLTPDDIDWLWGLARFMALNHKVL